MTLTLWECENRSHVRTGRSVEVPAVETARGLAPTRGGLKVAANEIGSGVWASALGPSLYTCVKHVDGGRERFAELAMVWIEKQWTVDPKSKEKRATKKEKEEAKSEATPVAPSPYRDRQQRLLMLFLKTNLPLAQYLKERAELFDEEIREHRTKYGNGFGVAAARGTKPAVGRKAAVRAAKAG